jgi:ribonuclease HI
MNHRKITDFFKSDGDTKPLKNIEVFIDGSCINNGKDTKHKLAGYAAVFPNDMAHTVYESLDGDKTNNRAETMGLIRALEICEDIDPENKRSVVVYSDSELLCNTVSKWMMSWKHRGWKKMDDKPVANLDLILRIDDLKKKRRVIMVHVKAHTNHQDYQSNWNREADLLAKKAAYSTFKTFKE